MTAVKYGRNWSTDYPPNTPDTFKTKDQEMAGDLSTTIEKVNTIEIGVKAVTEKVNLNSNSIDSLNITVQNIGSTLGSVSNAAKAAQATGNQALDNASKAQTTADKGVLDAANAQLTADSKVAPDDYATPVKGGTVLLAQGIADLNPIADADLQPAGSTYDQDAAQAVVDLVNKEKAKLNEIVTSYNLLISHLVTAKQMDANSGP